MPAAPVSPNEGKRIAAVQRLRLLGTPAEERFDKVTRLARRMFEVPMACIDIVGERVAWLKSVQGFDAIQGLRKDSYCHHTVLEDEIFLVSDAHSDGRVCDSDFANTWVFYAGVPLYFEGERVGVLCIGDSAPRQFDASHLSALWDLATFAEHELSNAALSQPQADLAETDGELAMQSRIDILTRLWNREAVLTIAAAELSRAADKASIAVLMIAVADLQMIRDTCGVGGADEVLRVFASRLRGAVRGRDAVGRFGDDRFLVVLPGISMKEVVEAGDRIRSYISRQPVPFAEHQIPVTCSIGCAGSSKALDSLEDLLQRADRALARAKSGGHNRMEVEPAPS